MKYCSQCGHAVEIAVPPGDNLPRHVCPACGTIHYQNPKLVVGCVAEHDGRILLCRRAIEPRRGYWTAPAGFLEIFFSHELAIVGQHVLLIEGLVHSGVTSEFLMNDLRGRGAASVKLATLLDRQSARRVQLQPDYFGFLVDEAFLVGYGLGSPEQTLRNLPYVAAAS